MYSPKDPIHTTIMGLVQRYPTTINRFNQQNLFTGSLKTDLEFDAKHGSIHNILRTGYLFHRSTTINDRFE